ncbi:nuclear transport factor 2 family protein [Sphingomonas sp. CROZ-RG-20F-R02-07]|uniref:nuclear transport factor 2 family protein n=1 Tax=Sphingomonas sp. CROZ-RG-20F-R02-07 TaxID=2914832 RepID=UPI001F578FDB
MLVILAAAAASFSPASTASALDRAVAEYDLAQQKGDGAALRRLLSDDYLLVNSGGVVETKEDYVKDLTAPDFHMEPFEVLRPISRAWYDGAIKGGVALLSGTSGGNAFSACLRFVDVWRLDGGKWRVTYSQAAKAAPADCRLLAK